MIQLYFLLTHFDTDRATRLNVRLLREYSASLFQERIEPHIVLLSTGSSLLPGNDEDVFVRMPNSGHHEGDMEMFNAGAAIALSRNADLIFKLSGNRIFLNRNRMIELILRLVRSDKVVLSDYWCNASQLSTDVVLVKASAARKIFPLRFTPGAVFSESLLARQLKKLGLWERVLLYNERQPIHRQDGSRRTGFYESIELLTNCEHNLEDFITKSYARYAPLLAPNQPDPGNEAPPTRGFHGMLPMRHGGLSLTHEQGRFELRSTSGQSAAVLNETAAAIWSMCDGNRTVETIQSQLAESLDLRREVIADDVHEALEDLLGHRLVWVSGFEQ